MVEKPRKTREDAELKHCTPRGWMAVAKGSDDI